MESVTFQTLHGTEERAAKQNPGSVAKRQGARLLVRSEAKEGDGWKADVSKVPLERSSHPPADRPSSELSQESGRSVQHGASSIPPAGCLGPVWGGLLTTGPPISPTPAGNPHAYSNTPVLGRAGRSRPLISINTGLSY